MPQLPHHKGAVGAVEVRNVHAGLRRLSCGNIQARLTPEIHHPRNGQLHRQ